MSKVLVVFGLGAMTGYGIGFGTKFSIGRWSLYLNPNYKMIRSPLPFNFNIPPNTSIFGGLTRALGQIGIDLGMGISF